MLKVLNLHKSYGQVDVLKGISLTVNKAEVVSVTGASGAGKSTLLQILGTLDLPDSGELLFEGENILKFSPKKLAAFRNRHIGFVFQFHHLLPEFNALENVCIPAMIAGETRKSVETRAKNLLEELGLSHRLTHKPSELSGGEQQRVAVARALINQPELILADEPTGNLDSTRAEELHQLFLNIRDQYHTSVVMVTHNEQLAAASDRIIHLKDGQISL